MARIKEVIRLSDYLKVEPGVIEATGAINPVLNYDSKYFIDPLLVSSSSVPIVKNKGVKLLDSFFIDIYDLLQASEKEGDVAWRAASRLLNGKEVSSINLGYGVSTTHGSSLSRSLADRLLQTASQIIRIGITNPKLFLLLPLLEDGIGPDTISDITAAAIVPALSEFSESVYQSIPKVEVSGFEVDTSGKAYRLVPHPFQDGPVLLVPHDIVRRLPIASSWDEISDVCAFNLALRLKFNAIISSIFGSHAKEHRSKLAAKRAVVSSKEVASAFVSFIEELQNDISRIVKQVVPDEVVIGRLKSDPSLLETRFEGWKSPETTEEAVAFVRRIVADYKFLIEDRRMSQLLYNESDEVRHERFAQMLFFSVAYARCRDCNIDITPEADTGNGPVDFKFSKGFNIRIVVEIKLSTNNGAVGTIAGQLRTYAEAEEAVHGIFVFLNVGRAGRKWEKISRLVDQYQKEYAVEAHYIDSRKRVSASLR